MNIEPIDEMEGEGDRDAQAVPLLIATTFGAIYLALGRQPIGIPFYAAVGLTQGVEVPCQTLKLATAYDDVRATGLLLWCCLPAKVSTSTARTITIARTAARARRRMVTSGCGTRAGATAWGGGRVGRKDFGGIAATKDIAARAASEMGRIGG